MIRTLSFLALLLAFAPGAGSQKVFAGTGERSLNYVTFGNVRVATFIPTPDHTRSPSDKANPEIDVPLEAALTIQGVEAAAVDLEFVDFVPDVYENHIPKFERGLPFTFHRLLLTVIISPNAP